jgi:outer membrane protein assembly factor BamB
MPADLDEMFATLGRQADALPLGPAASARRRGRQRSRRQLLATAAAVVGLIGGGFAVTTNLHRKPDPSPPAGPLPSIGKPISFGDHAPLPSIIGDTAYAIGAAPDGTTRIAAVDLTTGAERFPAHPLGSFAGILTVTPLPQALLLGVEDLGGGRTLLVLDPATGEQEWKLPFEKGDDFVYFKQDLVHMAAKTGETRAFDWATGSESWRQATRADRIIRTLGLHSGTDLPTAEVSGGRLLQVTKSGKVIISDGATGTVRETWPGSVAGGTKFVAQDAKLYSVGAGPGYVIRVMDRTGSRVFSTGPADRRVSSLTACGTDRICVLDTNGEDAQTAAAMAGPEGEVWRVEAPSETSLLESAGGRVLLTGGETSLLYAANGERLLDQDGSVRFLSETEVLSVGGDGKVARIQAGTGERRELGTVPAGTQPCVGNSRALICLSALDLRIWALPS